MNIAFWQVAIVLVVVVCIIGRKGIKDFIRGFNTPKHVIDAERERYRTKNLRKLQLKSHSRRELKREHEHAVRKFQQRKAREETKERVTASGSSGGSLTSKIARLQKLYKNGTLSKAEFEQAKNKLLK